MPILQAPDADTLEKFLARLPFVQTVVILSPHGFFGQANVLGLPDTGGQVSHSMPLHAITGAHRNRETGWAHDWFRRVIAQRVF